MLDPERATYVDLENLCEDDYQYLTHTGVYAPLPTGAKCVHCQSTESLGWLDTVTGEKIVVCMSREMCEGA